MFQQIFCFERLLCISKAEFKFVFTDKGFIEEVFWSWAVCLNFESRHQPPPYWPSLTVSIHQVRWAGGRLPPLWQTTSTPLPTTRTRLAMFSIWTVAGGTENRKMIQSPVTDNIGRLFLLLFPPLINQNLSELHQLDMITNSTLGIIKTKTESTTLVKMEN